MTRGRDATSDLSTDHEKILANLEYVHKDLHAHAALSIKEAVMGEFQAESRLGHNAPEKGWRICLRLSRFQVHIQLGSGL